MKKITLVVLVVLFGAVGAFAQTASDSITVTATNQGIFTFQIDDAAYAFGTVDSNGTTSGSGVPGSAISGGALYVATQASSWEVRSAPQRTVRIYNSSFVAPTLGWGAGTQDRLRMRIPGANTCGFKSFSTIGDGSSACSNGELYSGITAGNGTNAASGDLDFELTVLDTDAAGTNTWIVQLTAAGS